MCAIVLIVFKLTDHVHRPIVNEKYRVVETKFGAVRGILEQTLIAKKYFYSFKGIPYAKSPTGQLRFKVSPFLTVC